MDEIAKRDQAVMDLQLQLVLMQESLQDLREIRRDPYTPDVPMLSPGAPPVRRPRSRGCTPVTPNSDLSSWPLVVP